MDRASQAKTTDSQRSRRTRTISRDSFKEEVQSWAKRIGVAGQRDPYPTDEAKVGELLDDGTFQFQRRAVSRSPVSFRKEVIVHELLHMKVPNHGKLFKALLRAYLVS